MGYIGLLITSAIYSGNDRYQIAMECSGETMSCQIYRAFLREALTAIVTAVIVIHVITTQILLEIDNYNHSADIKVYPTEDASLLERAIKSQVVTNI